MVRFLVIIVSLVLRVKVKGFQYALHFLQKGWGFPKKAKIVGRQDALLTWVSGEGLFREGKIFQLNLVIIYI
jgi:hypothetical protein